jgi:hypothetical protein
MDEEVDGKRVFHPGDKSHGGMDEVPEGLALIERAPRFRQVRIGDSRHRTKLAGLRTKRRSEFRPL